LYNSQKYIHNTLDSVIAQTYQDTEIIVVDDKSKDDSVSIIKEYIKKHANISLIQLNKNKGVHNARNVGVQHATGEFIAFVDSDDLWLPEKLSMQLEFMKNSGAVFSYTGYDFIDSKGCSLNKQIRVPERASYARLLRNNVITTSTVIVSRDVILQHPMPTVQYEDYACWLGILKTGIMAYGIDTVLCHYRIMQGSYSSSKTKAAKWVWNILRYREKLSLPFTVYCMMFYTIKGFLKHFVQFKTFKV